MTHVPEIYLDNNATTRLLPEVREAIALAMAADFGNPSSPHHAGDKARRAIENAREQVAALVHVATSQIIFTSGATEANNTLIQGVANNASSSTPAHIVSCVTEHSSVLGPLDLAAQKGARVTLMPVDRTGGFDMTAFDRLLETRPHLVTIQCANSETGRLHPIKEIASRCNQVGVPIHTDASQVVGKAHLALGELGVDFATFTAHKIHGPSGTGALYARDPKRVAALIHGGQQEGGLRGGTQNVLGIIGFGVAADLRSQRLDSVTARMGKHRDAFEQSIVASHPRVSVNASTAARLPNTSNLTFRDVDGQALVARLEQSCVYCSQTTACTSRRPEPSYVLRAMGLSENDAYSSVRFSFGELNVDADVDEATHRVGSVYRQLLEINRRLTRFALAAPEDA